MTNRTTFVAVVYFLVLLFIAGCGKKESQTTPANLFAGFATHYVFIPFPTAYKDLEILLRPAPDVEPSNSVPALRASTKELC